MVDARHLDEMSDILKAIAKVIEELGRAAAKTEGGDGHEDPLVRINGSLADIREVMLGLNSLGDHSAEYAQIERSFRNIAGAVHDLGSASPSPE
jgi:hypothetical protein